MTHSKHVFSRDVPTCGYTHMRTYVQYENGRQRAISNGIRYNVLTEVLRMNRMNIQTVPRDRARMRVEERNT